MHINYAHHLGMIPNFKDPSYLLSGNQRQQKTFHTLQDLRVLEVLADFDPVLVGTIPIEVDLPNSDLDIICSLNDEKLFESTLKSHYREAIGFTIRKTEKQGLRTIIANFQHQAFEIEIFGQPLPVHEQMAFRHMISEYQILQERGNTFKSEVLCLKEQGLSTEAAFALILGIAGDPYQGLLDYQLPTEK